MNGKDFKESLKDPKNIYCLISVDSGLIDLYVNRFKEAIKADQISYGTIKPYSKLFRKKTLNVVYMPKLEDDIFKRNEFIFIYTDSIDKRTAIYKQYKDQIIEVSNDYTKHIMNNSNFTEEEAKNFAKINNNDLGLIDNNLALYKASDQTYDRFTNYSGSIYDWVNAFIKKEPLPPNVEESPISVMALLSNNCQSLLKIKQHDTLGLNPYTIQCLKPVENCLTIEQLVQIINDCFYLDCAIKKDIIDIKYVLPYLIARRYNVTN